MNDNTSNQINNTNISYITNDDKLYSNNTMNENIKNNNNNPIPTGNSKSIIIII